jgi:hypothetical protein
MAKRLALGECDQLHHFTVNGEEQEGCLDCSEWRTLALGSAN